jgi:hypothetical protein
LTLNKTGKNNGLLGHNPNSNGEKENQAKTFLANKKPPDIRRFFGGDARGEAGSEKNY